MGGTGPKYRNGYIPASELVAVERGHVATRGTAARWASLKADVLAHECVTLRISGESENAYRSFAGQQYARKQACARGRCNDAAVPGNSSHGGSLAGRDSGAIDVDNWAVLGKEKFYAYARKHGFEPGYFDWEPWHIIDWAPYAVPAAAGGNSTPTKKRDDDMYAIRQIGLADSGIIIRPGSPPYSLPAQIFETEASTYGLEIKELPDWRYGTAVREQWTAFNMAERFRADAKLSAADVQRIADAARTPDDVRRVAEALNADAE